MKPNQDSLNTIHALLIQAIRQLRDFQKSHADEDAVFEIEMGLEWTISRIRVLMDHAARPH
jgi:hypothetical protein